jgi:hypothetical protein
MNTDKSKEFTDKAMAEKIAKRREKELYLLGKNSRNNKVWYVGDYKDALKAKGKYKS